MDKKDSFCYFEKKLYFCAHIQIFEMKVSKITIKVIISYTLLVCVSLVAGYVILKEINKLSEQETINQQDRAKIVQVTKIITLVNDAENASRAAIRTDDKEALYVFLQKNLHLQT